MNLKHKNIKIPRHSFMNQTTHYPSLLFLTPTILATTFYTSEGPSALRLLAIGLFADAIIPTTPIVLIFAAAAISQTISSLRGTLFSSFDFFELFGVVQSFIGYFSACMLVFLKNLKKPSIHSYFLTCALLAASIALSLSQMSIYVFGISSPYFVGLWMSCGRLFLDLLIQSKHEFYDNEQYSQGFGVETVDGGQKLNQGDTYFNTIRKRYILGVGIAFVLLGLSIPLVFNYFGNYQPGFTGYLMIGIGSAVMLNAAAAILWLIKSNKHLRQIGVEVKQVLVASEEEKLLQNVPLTGCSKIRDDLKQFFKIDKRVMLWYLAQTALMIAVGLAYSGFSQWWYYITTAVFGFFSVKAILNPESPIILALLLVSSVPLTFNRPLPLLFHFATAVIISIQEKKSFSSFLLMAADVGCIEFSVFANKVIFTSVFATLETIIAFLPQKSKLSLNLIIGLHSLLLDILISLPRGYLSNIAASGLVLISILTYSQKFMQTAIGKAQSEQVVTSIIIRLVVSTVNGFLLLPGTSYEQTQILSVVVKWNGYFTFSLSVAMQVLSFFSLGDRISKWKYLFLIPLFIGIALVICMTPLCVIVTDLVMFATGFSNLFSISQSSMLQDTTLLVYQAFYMQLKTELGLQALIWLCRIFSGFLVAGAVLVVLNKKQTTKQVEVGDIFMGFFFASLLGLFASVPSAIAQMEEITEFSFVNDIILVLAFLGVLLMPMINPDSFTIKVVFVALYLCLVVFATITEMYSEGFVLFVFLIVLSFAPQSTFVLSYVISTLFLVAFVNTKYALATISYDTAISTLTLTSLLFFARFLIVKKSCIRRLTKKAKVEHMGCKVNSAAFNVGDEELDVFLSLQENEQTKNDNQYSAAEQAEKVYMSLKWQMYVFIFLTGMVLYSWNFYPLVAVLLSICATLIPVDVRDQDGKITQIAGYFGISDSFQINVGNRLMMTQRFCFCFFVLLILRVAVDLIAFIALYSSDKEGYAPGVGAAIKDTVCLFVECACAFVGYCYVTAQPKALFAKMIELQKIKILTVLTIVCVLASAFATSKALKLLPVFCVCGMTFTAPPTAAAGVGKRVVHIEPAVEMEK